MKKKKIAIFGSYNGTSIGDTAILIGMLNVLNDIYGDKLEVNVLVMNKINILKEIEFLNLDIKINEIVITEFFKSKNFIKRGQLILKKINNKFKQEVIKQDTLNIALKNVDLLIIGGGNLIMDLYEDSPNLIKKITDIANKNQVPYVFLGIGAGPLYTNKAKEIFFKILKNSKKIYVRDSKSKYLLESYYKNLVVNVIPDLAFGINYSVKKNKKNTLLVNIASLYSDNWPEKDLKKFDFYIENIVDIVKKLYLTQNFSKIKLFYSNYPLDRLGGKKFLTFFNNNFNIEEIDKKLSVKDLIELGAEAKLSFVTRLHAGITTYIGGAKIAAVSYQPKVNSILSEYNVTKYIFDLDFNNKDLILKKVIESLNDSTIQQNENLCKLRMDIKKIIQIIVGDIK